MVKVGKSWKSLVKGSKSWQECFWYESVVPRMGLLAHFGLKKLHSKNQ